MHNPDDVEGTSRLFTESDKNIVEMFKVLSELNRYRIFRILIDRPSLSVGEIATMLDISLSLTSQHIKILTQANLNQKERKGKKVYPQLEHENPMVNAIVQTIDRANR